MVIWTIPRRSANPIGDVKECWRDTYGYDRIIPRARAQWKH